MPKKIISNGKVEFPQKWEDGLRKGVVVVGNFVEKILSKAEGVASTVKGQTGTAGPVLSLEGQIPIPKIKELINVTVDRMIASSVPALIDRTALELREGQASLATLFRERGASVAVHTDIGGGAGSYGKKEPDINSVRCHLYRLPFEDGFFDFIVAHFASQYQGDISKDIKETARTLSISGDGIIIDFHPFGMFAKRGSVRLKPVESTIRGVEDYYKICKQSGLKVTGIRESFFDENLRSFFATEAEKQAFRMVKDSPFLIFIQVKKGG